jgi:two-component system, chemotaxis family, response regulator PixG
LWELSNQSNEILSAGLQHQFIPAIAPQLLSKTFRSPEHHRRITTRLARSTMESATGSSLHPPATGNPKGYNVADLASAIQRAIQSQINGQLLLKTHSGQSWTLSFRVGRLFWAGGGEQPYRRWRRLLKQFCKLPPEAVQFREASMPLLWEHWLLNLLIKRQKITRQDASALVEYTVEEVLFDILKAASEVCEISPMGDSPTDPQFGSEEPISILSTAEMLNRAQKLLSQWFNLGLMAHSPDGAPQIPDPVALNKQLPPKLAQALNSLATGKASIRELATITRQPLMTISNLMSQGIHKNLITLVPLADIPNPYLQVAGSKGDRHTTPNAAGAKAAGAATAAPRAVQAASPEDQAPLILCVDDSAQISYILEQIVQPAGYRFLGVQDPVGALSAILKQKPALVFLDLLMPLVYGNEICTQLRRAPAFRDLPIIMLSSNARMLDRLQAKGAGATDFMSKPIEADKVLALLNKYLTPSFAGAGFRPSPLAAQPGAHGAQHSQQPKQQSNQQPRQVASKS